VRAAIAVAGQQSPASMLLNAIHAAREYLSTHMRILTYEYSVSTPLAYHAHSVELVPRRREGGRCGEVRSGQVGGLEYLCTE